MTATAYAMTATDASPAAGRTSESDDHEVYCPDAQMWAPTDDVFCQFCGAGDHDLR